MEVLTLATSSQQEENYLGLVRPLNDPFHLYLRITDLQQGRSTVKFVCYSMGKKKVAMIGYWFQRHQQSQFRVVYACRYQLRQLAPYLQQWEEDFINTLNMVKNRLPRGLFQLQDQHQLLTNEDDYAQLKLWLAGQPVSQFYQPLASKLGSLLKPSYLRRLQRVPLVEEMSAAQRKILTSDLTGNYLDVFDRQTYLEALTEMAVQELEQLVLNYEAGLNLRHQQLTWPLALKINQDFYQWLVTSPYVSDTTVAQLQPCTCQVDQLDWSEDETCQILTWGQDPDLL